MIKNIIKINTKNYSVIVSLWICLILIGNIITSLQAETLSQKISPEQVLEKADRHRGLQNQSFALDIKINSMVGEKVKEEIQLTSYIDNETDTNNWDTLVRMTSPSRRKGQLILLENNRMWFYKPGTRRPIRISPAQRLMGGASTGDVVAFNFKEYYNITAMSDVKLNKIDAYLINLQKKKDTAATYDSVQLWVQKKTFFPIQSEFYSRSGRKLKTCYYGGFKKIKGLKRVTEMVIVDGVKTKNITKIKVLKMKAESLPRNFYNPEKLTTIGF